MKSKVITVSIMPQEFQKCSSDSKCAIGKKNNHYWENILFKTKPVSTLIYGLSFVSPWSGPWSCLGKFFDQLLYVCMVSTENWYYIIKI